VIQAEESRDTSLRFFPSYVEEDRDTGTISAKQKKKKRTKRDRYLSEEPFTPVCIMPGENEEKKEQREGKERGK